MAEQRDVAAASDTSSYYGADLTRCAGTWLAHPPDAAETTRIEAAAQRIREQRRVALAFHRAPAAARAYTMELFTRPVFAPLYVSDRLIERIVARVGEPPVVARADDPAFATYMRRAVLSVASARMRRDMAAQLRRFLPDMVAAAQWQEAVALDHSAFRTALGNEATPFLVQMTFYGLLAWYEHPD